MYNFYFNKELNIKPINDSYNKIINPYHLYDLLSNIWSEKTCAPRMRDRWTYNNKTLGQCSITAFLAQDIFGGDVYGIKLDDGNYHCYNVVGEFIFDLTCEQFNSKLNYDNNEIQLRENHFNKKEKYDRYKYLKNELEKALNNL